MLIYFMVNFIEIYEIKIKATFVVFTLKKKPVKLYFREKLSNVNPSLDKLFDVTKNKESAAKYLL